MLSFLDKIAFLSLKINADPDEMHIMRHLNWFFTVCSNTHFGITSILYRVKDKSPLGHKTTRTKPH